jgi:hypothetical protein
MGGRQQRWLQAIQNRVQATSEMLKSMKEVRLGGLQNLMADKLRGLRAVEVSESTPFKRALTLIVTLCQCHQMEHFSFSKSYLLTIDSLYYNLHRSAPGIYHVQPAGETIWVHHAQL